MKRSPGSAKMKLRDREFLPAAIELLETPASPIRAAMIWLLCSLVTITLIWAYFGTFDIVATAQGKIQPTGRVKIVQSEETGRVISTSVANGRFVQKGEILIELDPTAVLAEERSAALRVAALDAEIARRKASQRLLVALLKTDFRVSEFKSAIEPVQFPNGLSETAMERERDVFDADGEKFVGLFSSLRAQYLKAKAQVDSHEVTDRAQKTFISTLNDRVAMRSRLVDVSAGTRAAVMDAKETLQEAERDLASQRGQYHEAISNLDVIYSEARSQFEVARSENMEKLVQARRDRDLAVQDHAKANRRLSAMIIRSPDAGIVQTSAITTVGQLVTPGSELMRIVPDNAKLEIEAYLQNRDIGFVQAGQTAVIKIEAFPFTRYGILDGKVTRVATDAIPEPDARQLEEAAVENLQSTVPISNAQRVQNLVYPVVVEPTNSTIRIGERSMTLSPGMAVTIEIKTGQRRILEYLFSPLAEIASSAMNER